MSQSILKTFIPMMISFLIVGCSIVPAPGEPTNRFTLGKAAQIYDRDENISPPRKPKNCKKQLAVDLPAVYAPLDSQRISVIPAQNQLDYYAGIEWADRLSTLLQESLIYSLQDACLFGGVARTSNGLIPDIVLKMDVRQFSIDKTRHAKGILGTAIIELFVSLSNPETRHIIAEKDFSAYLPLHNEKKETIALTLNKANQEILRKIIEWIGDFG